jgi:hypothetical protein
MYNLHHQEIPTRESPKFITIVSKLDNFPNVGQNLPHCILLGGTTTKTLPLFQKLVCNVMNILKTNRLLQSKYVITINIPNNNYMTFPDKLKGTT